MARVGNSIIKGIDIKELVELLNRAYADEWLAYYQYFIESKVVKGIMKDAAIVELNQHAADELRHATMIADRIIQLGGTPLLHPKEWMKQTNCGYDKPKNFDVVAILQDAINGEQCAIKTYSNIVEFTKNKDIVTYDIVSQILGDEVGHEEDLQTLHDDITEFVQDLKKSLAV
ncbi:ferritin-like domain-containing protein [Sulfurimonas sp.]|uniref:ferritin-like domain-containing protein n=1 Tax=Sulfurimonas sp. TaxID=2022749 RepID=UPI0025E24BBE|nr:ferritin-like domain-containing protein [Sulfurimonas sp.]MDD5157337.1 ferritin-like domain-containing protein [Sulfurimonas sp.]